ncbi:hypothetical protein [Parabacteroides sp. Marseille-P3160]|uniref:hypothetical protein n=1 Tax=Parabacteroides sp. Marseille-P3160 TaxID=1917887 RepID=UPI000B422915|nr:hypothetical protein [Parabacteroides sp. Marseille-P3160]
MSVKGFNEVLKNFITIRIDNEFDIRITSLSGLFLLKLNAWIDRNVSTSKDAEDLCYILENYYNVFEERNIEKNYHQEVYEMDDFDTFVVGATWLGYDIAAILTQGQKEYYSSNLISELQKNEESRLIEQMLKQAVLSRMRQFIELYLEYHQFCSKLFLMSIKMNIESHNYVLYVM